MKKILFPAVALAVFGAVACSDTPTPTAIAPDGMMFELVDPTQRIAAADVNAHVYGSFSNLAFTYMVGASGGYGPLTSGAATGFPGNPKNAGTCDHGLWINPQGRRTSGSMERPHPHCVGLTEGSETEESMVVVLEPVSANFSTSEDRTSGQTWQRVLSLGNGLNAKVTGSGAKTEASGSVLAYAIDASTLDGTPVRVGTLAFNLADYTSDEENLFDTNCVMTGGPNAPRCLDKVIDAVFTPSAEFADKLEQRDVTGFLYWTFDADGKTPFNY